MKLEKIDMENYADFFPSIEDESVDDVDAIRLSTVHLKDSMQGVGKSLDWIEKSGVIVQSLRRRVGNSRGYSCLLYTSPSPRD